MTVYIKLEGYSFSGARLHAPGHDNLLFSDEGAGPELLAEGADPIYSFPDGTTEREILFYLAGETAGAREAIPERSLEGDIYAKLLVLIQLATQHGIDIEKLIHKALDRCDPEPPFSR
jgi:hypothetical protein